MPFPLPGDLPNPRIKIAFLASPALAAGFFTAEPPGKPSYPEACHVKPCNYLWSGMKDHPEDSGLELDASNSALRHLMQR